jgi:hypothetical protein
MRKITWPLVVAASLGLASCTSSYYSPYNTLYRSEVGPVDPVIAQQQAEDARARAVEDFSRRDSAVP